MRIVSPLLEAASGTLARNVEAIRHPVPPEARAAMQLGRELPGHSADPVFIVPGLTADRWMYRRGKEMLEAEGFVVGGMQMPWHGWGGIPGDAKLMRGSVEQFLEGVRRSGRDAHRVQLVGDSEGGLVSRQFLQFEGGQQLVSRLITNGTPNGGIRPLASDTLAAIGQRMLLPAGVKDLLVSSPVMQRLNGDWADFLVRARSADPDFEAHAIASRIGGRIDHDGLVPERAARMAGAPPDVFNYVTSGVHSINLAYGRRQTEAGHVLLAALGSTDPAARSAARRASAQAAEGARALE